MSITLNPPAGPWTVHELSRLPDDACRFEIHEGNLVMMSPANVWHNRTMQRLRQALVARGRIAEIEVGVKESDRSFRVADVAVLRVEPPLDQAYWAPAELEAVVEVVSDSSVDDDRVNKPRWYAMLGIPTYWRVERGDDGEAVIYQHDLARTAGGEAAYIQTGVTTLTTLTALESGS